MNKKNSKEEMFGVAIKNDLEAMIRDINIVAYMIQKNYALKPTEELKMFNEYMKEISRTAPKMVNRYLSTLSPVEEYFDE